MAITQLDVIVKHIDLLARNVCPTIGHTRFFNASLKQHYQLDEFSQAKYYPVDLQFFADQSGLPAGLAYKQCKELANYFMQETYTIPLEDGFTWVTRLFVDYKYDDTMQELSVQWNPAFIKKVSGKLIAGEFITVDTRMSAVQSNKRYLLYEYLQQNLWRLNKVGFFQLKLLDLRKYTNTHATEYVEFKEFKRNVLDTTLFDMNTRLNVVLKYDLIRVSRKVVKIHFYLNEDKSLDALAKERKALYLK
jgi:plasmid replication initiation protein